MSNRTISLPPESVKKILVCQLRQIGDVILATPAIHLLKERYPQAEIHVLTMKINKTVLEHNPEISRLWLIDRNEHKNLLRQLSFYLTVARERFDIIVDFQQLPRMRNVVALSRFFKPSSGRQVRLTFTPPWYNKPFYTHWVDMAPGYAAMSKASILRPLGLAWDGECPKMFFTEQERQKARKELAALGVNDTHFLVTVDPTHRRKTRQWPAEHYGKLIRLASEADPRLRFLIFYGPGEEQDARAVKDAAQCDAAIFPETMYSLREMAALIEQAGLHLGNCSAPRHMAVACGTPSFVVLGSTSQGWTFPSEDHIAYALKLDCQPCNENRCPRGDIACLRTLTAEKILPELQKHIDHIQRGASHAFSVHDI